MKSEAEGLRLGLALGVVGVPTVIAWADHLILSDEAHSAPVLLAISLSAHRSVGDVMTLLGAIPGAPDPHAVGRRLAGDLAVGFAAGDLDVVAVARSMYQIMQEGFAPDEAFENEAYAADDRVDTALTSEYDSLDAIGRDMALFLKRYLPSAASPQGPAA